MTPFPPMRVQVVLPNDPFDGRVGIVERIISDDEGLAYRVRFRGEPGDYPPGPVQTAYYRRDEITAT
jgi:hypothetical protein